MKEFKTITTKELLYAAYATILDRWAIEDERNDAVKALGITNPITQGRVDKYKAQLDELHTAILALENAE